MTGDEFALLLQLGNELRGVEFKGPGSRTEQPLQAKVIRAALGMANRRNGGHIIIGVSETDGVLQPIGLSNEQLASWNQYDRVNDLFSAHADPPIYFELEPHVHEGKNYMLITVHEFEDLPVLCKKHHIDKSIQDPSKDKHVLRDGACYVRPRRKHETSEIPTSVDMRDLLDLAVQKGVARFVTQAHAGGLSPLGAGTVSDPQEYEREREDWDNPSLTAIRSRGYWEVIIRPERYAERRIANRATLRQIIERAAVDMRGWDFPYVDREHHISTGATWVGQDTTKHDMEAWRFYLSGQFIDLFGFEEDWVDVYLPGLVTSKWKPGQWISVEAIVYRFTEVFELAKRLVVADEYRADGNLHIEATLHRLRDRQLARSNIASQFRQPYTTEEEHYCFARTYSRDQVIATPRDLARAAAADVFDLFGWQPSDDHLRTLQEQIGR